MHTFMEARAVTPGAVVDASGLPEPIRIFAVVKRDAGAVVTGIGISTGRVHTVTWSDHDLKGVRRSSTVVASDSARVTDTSLPVAAERLNNYWYAYNDSDTAVVFVHGIFATSRSCWLHRDKQSAVFWPDLLRVDGRFQDPSIYLAGYHTAVDAGDFPLDQCARQVLEALERPDVAGHPPVLDKRHLVFVCHSTGGIVVRYLLTRYGRVFHTRRIGLALIASPSRGSIWADVAAAASWYYNQRLGSQLQWRGEAIEDIHSRFKELTDSRAADFPGLFGMEACETQMVFRRSLPKFVKWFIPNRLRVVTAESAGQYFGQVKYLPGTDHFSSVKPDSLTHPSHEFLETFFRRFNAFLAGLPPQQNRAPQVTVGEPSSGIVRQPRATDAAFWDRYLDSQRSLIDEHRQRFVGRSDVDAALVRFLKRNIRGCFILVGGPGLGKTALASHIVEGRNALYHLCRSDGDRGDPRLILCSLVRQAANRLGVDADLGLDTPTLAQQWVTLLGQLAATSSARVTVVIDAIDEVTDEDGHHFLPDARLPPGVYFIVTSRKGARLEGLREQIADLPSHVRELRPLTDDQMGELIHRQRPTLTAGQRGRVAEISRGNPLHLQALLNELDINPQFDANELPDAVDEYYRRVLRRLPDLETALAVAQLLAVARGPLALRSLSEISGLPMPDVERVVLALEPVLAQSDAGVSLYHQTFTDFLGTKYLDVARRREAHSAIARWLKRNDSPRSSEAWQSLAYHLYNAGDSVEFYKVITEEFLAAKAVRFGFAVLEDVEFLTRCLLDAGEPALIERTVAMVESLRRVAGGDFMTAAERTVHLTQAAPGSGKLALLRRSTSALDVCVGILPKVGVSADFVEVVPNASTLWIIIGDVPGAGLKSAFVARFIANLFRKFVLLTPEATVQEVLMLLHRALRPHDYFDRVSLQCAVLDPAGSRFHIASAGHPYPVLFSAAWHVCARLPIRGPLLEHDGLAESMSTARTGELNDGDVLVLVSDGLTEGGRLQDPYGYQFCAVVRDNADQPARVITERIFADWRRHARPVDWTDDATIVVAVRRDFAQAQDEN
jgi:hypothetical protein